MHSSFKPVLHIQIVIPLDCSHQCQPESQGPFPTPTLVETVEDVVRVQSLVTRIGNLHGTPAYGDADPASRTRIYKGVLEQIARSGSSPMIHSSSP